MSAYHVEGLHQRIADCLVVGIHTAIDTNLSSVHAEVGGCSCFSQLIKAFCLLGFIMWITYNNIFPRVNSP